MPVMLDATLVARWGIDEVVGGRWIIRVVGICGKWPLEEKEHIPPFVPEASFRLVGWLVG